MAYLTNDQLNALNFKHLGGNVRLSDKAVVYGAERIEIGDNTRIDDFCLISAGQGGIKIGKHVHVACYCSLIGAARITLEDFSGISGRVSVYSSSDDFSGDWLTGPTVAEQFTNVDSRPVTIGRHVVVGVGSVVLPGVEIGEGSTVGALSLVSKSCGPYGIYVGVPARFAKARSRKVADLELEFMAFLDRESGGGS